MIDPKAVAERIWEIEWKGSGVSQLCGYDVCVENVRVDGDSGVVLADVIFRDFDGEAERTEKYFDCRYPFSYLGL